MRWDREDVGLDIALLHTEKPMEIGPEGLVTIPERAHWLRSSTLYALGYPTAADNVDVTTCFPRSFLNHLRHWSPEYKERILSEFFKSSVNDWAGPLAFFGSAKDYSDVRRGYYGASSMSLTFGVSGGPVFSLDHPGELVGLAVGGFSGYSTTTFLDVQTPSVKALYNFCTQAQP